MRRNLDLVKRPNCVLNLNVPNMLKKVNKAWWILSEDVYSWWDPDQWQCVWEQLANGNRMGARLVRRRPPRINRQKETVPALLVQELQGSGSVAVVERLPQETYVEWWADEAGSRNLGDGWFVLHTPDRTSSATTTSTRHIGPTDKDSDFASVLKPNPYALGSDIVPLNP